MNRRFIYTIGVVVPLMLVLMSVGVEDAPPEIFQIGATYSGGYITISFTDESGDTIQTIVEIQGMDETYYRTFVGDFEERVPFPGPPRYGWGAHPIIFDIQHHVLGDLRIKTEARDVGEPPARLILER